MAGFESDKDQKTEEATPRRRDEAREKGQVAQSSELVAALMLMAGLGWLVVGGGRITAFAGAIVVDGVVNLGARGRADLSVPEAAKLIEGTLRPALFTLALFIVPLLSVGLLAGYGQVGFRLTPKAVAPDLSKLNPVKGVTKMFSARSVMRAVMAMGKILAIATTMIVVASGQIENIVRLGPAETGPMLVGLGYVALRCTAGALIAILALSLFDFAFQRWQQERDLRMTKQEVKDEHKNTEGDPHVKARIRSVQREMATRRMMAEVPKATVVITNPTHYAVALRYERDEAGRAQQDVPVVVAKGVDRVAQRIKEIARESNVVCYEDVPLARALHAQVEVGEEIPGELYAAVATVLSYVYKLRGATA